MILSNYLSTIEPLKIKLECLLYQYFSIQGIQHPLKENFDQFKGIHSITHDVPIMNAHRILKIQ